MTITDSLRTVNELAEQWARDQRDELRAARDAQDHREHPDGCTCGCRFDPALDRP